MRRSQHRRLSGLTLIETTFALALTMVVSGMLIAQIGQHGAIMSRVRKSRFLTQEAPLTNLVLAKTLGNSEDFQLYADRTNAINNTSRVTDGSRAVKMFFRAPLTASTPGATGSAIISFETVNSKPGLYFYLQDSAGGWAGAPSWAISTGDLSDASFSTSSGLLQVTLSGSYGEVITYAVEKK